MGWGHGNGKEVEGVPCPPKQPRLSSRSVILSGATTALGRKQDMKESVDSATATGGDVTATPPALAAVDFDVDRQPGCFCTAHNANAGAAAYGEKKKNVESKQVSPNNVGFNHSCMHQSLLRLCLPDTTTQVAHHVDLGIHK